MYPMCFFQEIFNIPNREDKPPEMTDQDAKCRKNGHIDLWGSFQTVEPSPWSLLRLGSQQLALHRRWWLLENLSLSSMILRTKPPFCEEGKKTQCHCCGCIFCHSPGVQRPFSRHHDSWSGEWITEPFSNLTTAPRLTARSLSHRPQNRPSWFMPGVFLMTCFAEQNPEIEMIVQYPDRNILELGWSTQHLWVPGKFWLETNMKSEFHQNCLAKNINKSSR